MPAFALFLGLFLVTSGCAHRVTDFTVISTKNVNLATEKGPRVMGKDCGVLSIDLKQAIDHAIEGAGHGQADMLIDGVVTFHDYLLWRCYSVHGNAASSRAKADPG